MGSMEKGSIRRNYIILCKECWDRADAAIRIVETARSTPSDNSTPDFIKDLFGKFSN